MWDTILITPISPFLEDQFVLPNLSTLLLKGWLNAYGPDHRIKVMNLVDYNNDYTQIPEAKYYGLSFTTPNVPEAIKISSYLRANRHAEQIIAGGPHPSALPKDTLDKGICDTVIRGAGETALLQILNTGSSIHSITRDNLHIRELDAHPQLMFSPAPPPNTYNHAELDYSDIDYLKYKIWLIVNEYGCPYDCNFCYKIFSGLYRFPFGFIDRCIGDVLTHGIVRNFKFASDNIFIAFDKYTLHFKKCYDHGISFEVVGRLDNLKPRHLRLLKDFGCSILKVGLETGSQTLLKSMNKRENILTIKKGFDLLNKIGINYGVYLIANYPGEQMEDVESTIRFVNDLDVKYIGVSDYTPYPGTPDWYNRLTEDERTRYKEDFGTMHHLGKLQSDQMSEHKRYLLTHLNFFKDKINL